jgi:hypothetical protein
MTLDSTLTSFFPCFFFFLIKTIFSSFYNNLKGSSINTRDRLKKEVIRSNLFCDKEEAWAPPRPGFVILGWAIACQCHQAKET